MSAERKIASALISVFDKTGLEPIISRLAEMGVEILSTGGTADFIRKHGVEVKDVSDLTTYPSFFGGRVKTLHPAVFGGILYRRELEGDRNEAAEYKIPSIDLVIVDLYPFEDAMKKTYEEQQIIEKIDIGGISLIRASAKNYKDVLIVPSREYYDDVLEVLNQGGSTLEQRKLFAARAFDISSHYDSAIFNWFNRDNSVDSMKMSLRNGRLLRYGENPHQSAKFYGELNENLEQLNGKELSYNNFQDISGALDLISEFEQGACVIVKHSNACGLALREKTVDAWTNALAADPVSAFGGIIAFNRALDYETCEKISEIFFEVLIAPDFDEKGLELLKKKKNRIVLKLKKLPIADNVIKTTQLGVLVQENDRISLDSTGWELKAGPEADEKIMNDSEIAMRIVKHLKSNAVVLVRNSMMIGAGNGQTNRVDAVKQSIEKAQKFELEIDGAVLGSDAFFPFADSVELAFNAGVKVVVEPGGSVRDDETIEFCKKNNITLLFTGSRHFKH